MCAWGVCACVCSNPSLALVTYVKCNVVKSVDNLLRTQVVADYTFLYMRGAHLTQSMSENVKISCAETMSQIFRHIVISTHTNVEMSLAETMCTFFGILQICKGSVTDGQTDGRTDKPI